LRRLVPARNSDVPNPLGEEGVRPPCRGWHVLRYPRAQVLELRIIGFCAVAALSAAVIPPFVSPSQTGHVQPKQNLKVALFQGAGPANGGSPPRDGAPSVAAANAAPSPRLFSTFLLSRGRKRTVLAQVQTLPGFVSPSLRPYLDHLTASPPLLRRLPNSCSSVFRVQGSI
jgi:hypothetical protein